MIGFKGGKYVDTGDKLVKAFRKAQFAALRVLGFRVMETAQKSIKDVPGHAEEYTDKKGRKRERWVVPSSPAGTPPYTHPGSKKKRTTSGFLPGAIVYDTEKDPDDVIIGTSAALFANVGKPHEHSGDFRSRDYPERPFMEPAMAQEIGALPRLIAEQWDASGL
jgi:hypothetical protein